MGISLPSDTEHFSDAAFWALAATLNAEEVLASLSISCEQPWPWRKALVGAAAEIADTDPNVVAVATSLCDSLENDDKRVSRLHSRADASLRHVLRLLPATEQAHRGLEYLSHPRSARRKLGLRVLRAAGHGGVAHDLIAVARAHKDFDALFSAIVLGGKVDDPDWALELAGDDYIAARILQTILDQESIARFNEKYPRALAWAIGRARSDRHSEIVRGMLRATLSNLPSDYRSFSRWKERVRIAFWALGRLGLRADILHFAELEASARRTLLERGDTFAAL